MIDRDITITTKRDIRMKNRQRQHEQANKVYGRLTPELKRRVDLAKEKAPLHGYLLFQLNSMDSSYIKGSSETPYPFDMDGS